MGCLVCEGNDHEHCEHCPSTNIKSETIEGTFKRHTAYKVGNCPTCTLTMSRNQWKRHCDKDQYKCPSCEIYFDKHLLR